MRGLTRLCGVAAGILLVLVATSCDSGNPGYRKNGTDASQANADYDDCRTRVNAYLAKERGIDEDRRGAMAGGGIPGAGSVRRGMDGSTDNRRSGSLVRECMQQKGDVGGEPDRAGIRW
jgi:hypothetical protein